MERVWGKSAAMLGLILGVGPAVLAHRFPHVAGLNQFGVACVGTIIGMRAAAPRRGLHLFGYGAGQPSRKMRARGCPL